jgi:hypothetical protein
MLYADTEEKQQVDKNEHEKKGQNHCEQQFSSD